ncbi:VOC family protein [Allopusillimonas ginsengisoli]|uniref:VOC family protein n=1 Tax=Allopusillimonas ginsengisoli TaxID=453575 RepID=UPI0010C1E5C1|nr:VOC family protein [Allopusillimonas ginsengisoli]
MFSHVFVSVTDFDRALRFYDRLFAALGVKQRFCDPNVPWAGWHSTGAARPFFVICKPFNGEPHDAGNGQMTAFLATSRDQVHQAYSVALAAGGTCEGEPGLRPQYHADYFGAYFRDPEGNKLCVACHRHE